VVQLLDEGQAELAAGGAAFPFTLPGGFFGFGHPGALQQVQSGTAGARAVYQNQFADALPRYRLHSSTPRAIWLRAPT